MLGAEMPGYGFGVFGFVKSAFVETNGKSFDRKVALSLHERHDGGRIHAAGKESPQRHICNHTQAHRAAQMSIQGFDSLDFIPFEGMSKTALDDFPRRPVGNRLFLHRTQDGVRTRLLIRVDRQDTARSEFVYAAINRVRGRDVIMAQIEGQRVAVYFNAEVWMGAQGFKFGAKEESRPSPSIV